MSRALVEAGASITTAVGDPDPHDWRLFVKTVAAFALLLLIVDLLL